MPAAAKVWQPVLLLAAALCAFAPVEARAASLSLRLELSIREATPSRPEVERHELYAVEINGVDTGREEKLIRQHDGRLLASAEQLERWRIRGDSGGILKSGRFEYFPLDGIDRVTSTVDTAAQKIILDVPSSAMSTYRLQPDPAARATLSPPSPGAFINYDVAALRVDHATNIAGVLEAGVFNDIGSGTSSFLWHNSGTGNALARLESRWVIDRPGEMASLRFGDSISHAGSWGGAVRIGGIQWSTNFLTQPGFITFPMPAIKGEAALPSSLDVFVNNSLMLHGNVPQGPFEISRAPLITGDGMVHLVVRDLLGREQHIVQPYYSSTALLKPGLTDFSYEAGFVREDYGVASHDYGRFVAAATHRKGVSERFTREWHAELTRNNRAAGISAVYLLPFGVANGAIAASRGANGKGGLTVIGLEHQSPCFSLGMQGKVASRMFTYPTNGSLTARPRETVTFHAGGAFAGYSISGAYVYQSYWNHALNKFVSLGLFSGVANKYHVGVTALKSLGRDGSYSINLTLTAPLGGDSVVSTYASIGSRESRHGVSLQNNLPEGDGIAYRLRAETGDNTRQEVGVTWQTAKGSAGFDASRGRTDTVYRARVNGAVGWYTVPFLSRTINDSFAIAKVGRYPGVRVYVENREAAKTDANGFALIPRLRPYQSNRIGIEPSDLPMDAQVNDLQVSVAPWYRSGVFVDFGVSPARAASLRIRLKDGSSPPPGAAVMMDDAPGQFLVAYNGEAYVTGLSAHHKMRVRWEGKECGFELDYSDGANHAPINVLCAIQ